MNRPAYLVTAEEMRNFDAVAINEYGIPGVVLMENAGRSTFQIVREYLGGDVRGMTAAVVAGPGNNGGDGYVIARYLINHGAEVHTFLLSPREKIKGDALVNLQILEKMTDRIIPIEDEDSLEEATGVWRESDVVVDAILGTGLNAEVRSPYREAILEFNACPGFRVAVDLPSGLNADTGRVLGVAVQADLTVTYGFQKLGTALYPGLEYCGRLEVVDISIPLPAIEKSLPRASLYAEADFNEYFLLRSNPEAHKGTFGHVLVVGGSPGKTGAPTMTAMAASRMGAGLVTVGIPASLNAILEVKLTEEMTEPLPEPILGYLGEGAAERVLSLAEGKSCLALGPGISTREGIGELIVKVLAEYDGWVVIDADGLNCLVPHMAALKHAKARVVLTPHPGEMGRLTGTSAAQVQHDRMAAARTLAVKHSIWVVLKGARTLTASPDGHIFVNTTGSPWMASGGQGDALTGILAGLLGQRIPPEVALPFGVYMHGLAADRIVERTGPHPVIATDVINELPVLLGRMGKQEEGEESSCCVS
jgi:ADP-dependent NAD(P)H-hydrate dehydratase / NAD(P)H-hydrate epimerase